MPRLKSPPARPLTEGECLLAAVLADPGDDAPRLVYADWLEGHGGGAWANLIRVQCESEQQDKRDLLAEWNALDAADVLGIGPGVVSVARHLAGTGGPRGPVILLRRGFVHHWEGKAADWLRDGPALVAGHPVGSVRLDDKHPTRIGTGRRFHFFRAGRTPPPPLAWDELPDELWRQRKADGWRFPSREDAESALSAAALAWARNPEG